jgi:serine/threonine-protein kinase
MECVTGGNLKERIEKEGPLPPGEAVSVAQQVAEALRAAHERGVIHRDIKPQNILMTESGQAKVADFGIAWAASSSTLTKTGFVVGTAHYLSPEQALGQPASPRSDLYSLGVVLYEMLTGQLPHDAETPVSIAMKHVSGRFRPPKEVNPHVPEGLNALTVRLLAREPEERYQDAGELVGDLERVGQGRPPAFVSRQPAAKPAEGSTRPPVAPLPPTEEEAREAAGPHDDRYSRIRYLGGGGMAEVYLARDRELDRDVAFKVLRKQYTEDEQFVERFKREARNAASLNHPNIVSIHDRGETKDGAYYMVMEYVSGGTLKERILKEQTLPAPEAASVAQQVAEALRAAHERGVIHRDIKPQNILMTESGEAKVADFGIARAASSSTVTKTGSIMGTAHYLSPEQALGNPATPRSDLYSLGVVLYEMLTGELPHDAETPIGIAMKHVSGHLRPPKEVNPNVPEGLNALTVRLLAKDPAERYTDADALIADLERVRRGELPAAVATAQGEVPNGAAGTVAEPPDSRGAGGQPRQGEAIRVSPAEQETVPNRETARPSHTPQNSSLRNKKKVLLLAGVIGILLVLLASGGAMALTDIGPVANLFGGLERQPADEGSAAQSPDTQKGAAAGEKSTEETSSPSDNSTASQKSAGPEAPASGSPGQAPTSQPTAKQDSPPPTVEIPDLAGRTRSEASSKLTDVGLKLGNQNEASDDKVPEGKIVGQNPAAGTKAEPGSAVDIPISSGPKKPPPTTGASPPPPPTKGTPPPQKK